MAHGYMHVQNINKCYPATLLPYPITLSCYHSLLAFPTTLLPFPATSYPEALTLFVYDHKVL